MNGNKILFGNILRELRTAEGLTQEQLGERINVSANAVGQFERGVILPNYVTIANIINTLDIDANLLFSRDTVDYPDEAKWIAKILVDLSYEEKQVAGHFLESIAKIILNFENLSGGSNENRNLR